MLGGGGEAIIQFGAHPADLLRLFRQPVLPPDLRHRAGDGDEVGGGRQQHPLVEGEVPQVRAVFERGGNEVFARDEHHHVVGRFGKLRLVALGAERLDVLAHRLDVFAERALAGFVVGGLEGFLIGV